MICMCIKSFGNQLHVVCHIVYHFLVSIRNDIEYVEPELLSFLCKMAFTIAKNKCGCILCGGLVFIESKILQIALRSYLFT